MLSFRTSEPRADKQAFEFEAVTRREINSMAKVVSLVIADHPEHVAMKGLGELERVAKSARRGSTQKRH